MKPVDYLPGARRDFDESFDWYAERSAVAVGRFTTAVDAALREIAADPERFSRIDAHHHGCTVKRFPFRIVDRIEPTKILVVTVAHAKRRPGYWKRRG